MKIQILLFFFCYISFSQFSNFQSKTYYHNLSNDITYSYFVIADKHKINADRITSTVEVKSSVSDSLVYRQISELKFTDTQSFYELQETLPIILNKNDYNLVHFIEYGATKKMIHEEKIAFSSDKVSELNLFNGKSNTAKYGLVDLNGTFYMPNLDSKFSIGKNNALYWYVEFYDLPLSSDTVVINYTIFDESGEANRKFTSAFITPEKTFFDEGVYNVMAKLKSGKYRLNLSLKVNDNLTLDKNAFFEVIKEKPKQSIDLDYVKFDVDYYYVKHKLESDEREFFLKLGEEKQVEYIAAFFIKLSELENKSIRQIRAEIDEMAAWIQVNYGNQSFNPYTLDATFLLFKYGPPSHRDIINNDDELVEYEIWQYDTMNSGVKFYLSNYRNTGIKIIHCDDPSLGYTNRNWKRLLRKM